MDVFLFWVLCVVRQRALRRTDPLFGGLLPTVVCPCVWSRATAPLYTCRGVGRRSSTTKNHSNKTTTSQRPKWTATVFSQNINELTDQRLVQSTNQDLMEIYNFYLKDTAQYAFNEIKKKVSCVMCGVITFAALYITSEMNVYQSQLCLYFVSCINFFVRWIAF